MVSFNGGSKVRPVKGRFTTCLLLNSLLVCLCVGILSDALRMLNLDVPEFVSQGDTIHLSCFFSLQNSSRSHSKLADLSAAAIATELGKQDESPGESDGLEPLYAIKWYKDGREFYRYTANSEPKKRAFPYEGITVDLTESNDQTIKLINVTLKTGGLYKCEVSTDAPFFVTKDITRKLSVFSLPNEGPVIDILRPIFPEAKTSIIGISLGDKLTLLCRSHESKPAASLDWIINDSLNLSAIYNRSGSSKQDHVGWLDIRQQNTPIDGPSQSLSGDKLTSTPLSLGELSKTIPRDKITSIDHLVEKSTSQLELTIDTDLLNLLGIAKAPQSIVRSNNRRSIDIAQASKPQDNQAYVLISSNSILVNNPFSESLDGLQTHSKDNATKLANDRSQNKKKPKKTQKKNMNQTHQIRNHLALIEIKCTATILQLQMSDKIRMQLIDKQFTDNGSRMDGSLNAVKGAQTKERKGSSSNAQSSGLQSSGFVTLASATIIVSVLSWIDLVQKFR